MSSFADPDQTRMDAHILLGIGTWISEDSSNSSDNSFSHEKVSDVPRACSERGSTDMAALINNHHQSGSQGNAGLTNGSDNGLYLAVDSGEPDKTTPEPGCLHSNHLCASTKPIFSANTGGVPDAPRSMLDYYLSTPAQQDVWHAMRDMLQPEKPQPIEYKQLNTTTAPLNSLSAEHGSSRNTQD